MKLVPLNDVGLVQIDTPYQVSGMKLVSGDQKKSTGSGILVELPDELLFLGFHSFAFENSLGKNSVAEYAFEYYSKLVGKRVYWTALAERGMIFNDDTDTYALIKLTDLVGYSDADTVFTPEVTEIKY